MGEQLESPQTLSDRIVASLGAGVLVVDSRGTVRVANARARTLLGGSAKAESADFVDAAGLRAVLAAAADPGLGWKQVVLRVNGEPRVLGVHTAPLARNAAPPEGTDEVVLLLTDLTDVRAADAAARAVAALAGVERFAQHVAHELKNPLGALKLYTLLLERQLRDVKPDSRELTEKIGRAVDNLASAVAEVTTPWASGPLKREAVAVDEMLDRCLANAAERMKEPRVEVVRRYEPGLRVRGNPRALEHAVSAFIDNALNAMAHGGTLTVSATRDGQDTVGITVEDTGAGLSPEAQARLFEPFFTAKLDPKKPDKVGLGATIAGHIVQQHGGRTTVRSEPNVGTTIRIALPAD